MTAPLACLALGAALTLAGCRQSSPANDAPAATAPPAEASTRSAKISTEAEARAATAAHISTLPNAALFVVDSARVNDNGPTWQVLVPRRDWARRMPNSARFEVSKATGEVSTGTVK